MMVLTRRLALPLVAALIVCAAASTAAAQDQPPSEFESWGLPCWSFTPGIVRKSSSTSSGCTFRPATLTNEDTRPSSVN